MMTLAASVILLTFSTTVKRLVGSQWSFCPDLFNVVGCLCALVRYSEIFVLSRVLLVFSV